MSVIYPFPVLHHETMDYEAPELYEAEMRRHERSIIEIKHKITTNNLVASLISENKAMFFSTISARGTVFRCTETLKSGESNNGETAIRSSDKGLSAKQQIEIPEFKNSPTLFANSGVVALQDIEVPQKKMLGVSDFFTGPVFFPKNSLMAFSGWRRFFSMSSLFHICSNKELDGGIFTTDIYPSPLDAFQIRIEMSPKLFDEVETNRDGSARAHVICTALTAVLQELRQLYIQQESSEIPNESELQQLEQAEGLKSYLISKEIPTWENDNFNSAHAASLCRPALLNE